MATSFKHPIFQAIHALLLPAVVAVSSNRFIANFQRICGITEDGIITNFPFYLFFKLASQVGEDVIILPFIIWFAPDSGPSFISHLLIMLMSSQILKDLLLLPRPPKSFIDTTTVTASPRKISIAKLEGHFGTEYGFPSSHTVSGLLPLAFLVIIQNEGYTVSQYQIAFSILFLMCVAASRLYVGVHSPADLCGGAFLGSLILILSSNYCIIDYFVLLTTGHVWSCFVCANIVVMFVYYYPRANPWRASFGTAALILGFWLGAALSFIYLRWNHADYYSSADADHVKGVWWDGRVIARTLRGSSLMPVLPTPSPGMHPALATYQARSQSQPQDIWTIAAKSVVGVLVTLVCYVVGKTSACWLFLRLRYLRANIKTQAQSDVEVLIDVNGDPVPLNKLYSVEIPTR